MTERADARGGRQRAAQPATAPGTDFPGGIGAPATRALVGAGYTRLDQLTRVREADLGRLHGVGPKALRILRESLAADGRAFAAAER